MIARLFAPALVLLAALFAAVPAAAHQQKLAISTVSINPRTDRVEIVHQVPLHDAETRCAMVGFIRPISSAAPTVAGPSPITSRHGFPSVSTANSPS